MFIRRALAVSLSLLFVLSLFFPLKTVMAASSVAPAPAPPAVVPQVGPSADNKQPGANGGKQTSTPPPVPSDDNKQPSAPPAVPSDDNKQPSVPPSPAGPKAEAGLSQEPKQAVSPEAEQKKPEAQQPSVAAPPVANEEKKNDSSEAKVKVPSKVQAAGAALADDDLPPWREKLDEEAVMQMAGCEAIADHEHKQIIIRPKNGAKEGVITSFPSPYSSGISPGDFTDKFCQKVLNDAMAMLEVISSTEGYTLKFEKRIYFYGMLTPYADQGFKFNFLNCNPTGYMHSIDEIPVMIDLEIPKYGHFIKDRYKVKGGGSTLASLGNIADVNAKFLSNLDSFLPNSKNIKDISPLAKLKCSKNLSMWEAFKYMKALTGYADFSNFQAGTDKYIRAMAGMFEGAGTDDFVLNFSNKKLFYKSGKLFSSCFVGRAFKDFKGVLIANNWEHEKTYEWVGSRTGKKKIKTVNSLLFNQRSEFRSPDQLFGVKKKDAEKGYSLSSLVVTDNPELLKIKKNSKYYKKITISYLDQKEELELPAIYDSRITATGACDQNQPASADYMKIVKYQVDEAIRAKVAEIKRKCGLPDNFPLEAVPTKAISSTPTSLFQEYRLPIKINELMISPQKQVVCENAAIEKININFIYADNKKLQRFHLDTAALEQQLPQGLKLHVAGNNLLNSGLLHFFPLAVGFNGSPLLQVLTQPVATISGTIQCDDSKVTKKKVDGKEEYYVYLTISGTAEYADGSSGVLNQKAEIQVLPNIPVGNKPETSSTLSAYLILAGALSVILTGRSLAKK